MTMPTPAITTAATTSTTPRRRRSRRLAAPRPPAGARARLGAAALGLTLLFLAIPRIVSGALILPHEPVIRLVQHGADIPVERLVEARRAYEAAIAWHGGADEWAGLAVLQLRLALTLGISSPGGRAVLESARESARQALARTPADPYVWAQLAEAERILEGPGPAFRAALMRSVATGPHEPTLAPFRAALGLGAWDVLNDAERERIADQVRVAAELQPERLRRAVTDPLRMRLIAEILEGRPDLYARLRGGGS